MAAFKLAVEQQADGIELDTKLTADEQVVVFHDETIDRTTNGTGHVHSLTLSELKKFDAGSKFNPIFSAEKIPTLEEVFTTIGSEIFINIELSNIISPLNDLPVRVVSLIEKYGMESSVMLSSFNPIALIRTRYLLPEVPLGFITHLGIASAALHSGLVRFGPLLALHPRFEDVNPELVRAAHAVEARIHPYIVNQADQMKRFFDMGVDGIFTDDPLLAQKVLAGVV